MITLTLKDQPTVPLEAEVLSPDVTAGLTSDAIRALPVHLGKRQSPRWTISSRSKGRRATSWRSAVTRERSSGSAAA